LVWDMTDRILILDDDEQLAQAYYEHFKALGYHVDCATELEEAEALLGHFPYSVVITDLRLSKLGFGGLDLVKHIRELALKTRIVVLTGYGWPELQSEALAQEVDAFLRKPTRLTDLVNMVGQLTGGQA